MASFEIADTVKPPSRPWSGAPEYIRPFDGSGDVGTWIKKVELICRIKKVDDEAAFIPLYLEGTAFTVYDQMDKRLQDDAYAIKKLLREAFGQNKYSAFDSFRQRSWRPGESVDAFLSDLRRLTGLSGVESDDLLRCAFVCGLPEDVSSQLRASSRINEAELTEVLEVARVLMDERIQGAFVAAQGARVRDSGQKTIKCFECGGNHPARFCKRKSAIICWRCEEPGHIARNCPNARISGNASRKPSAPPASSED